MVANLELTELLPQKSALLYHEREMKEDLMATLNAQVAETKAITAKRSWWEEMISCNIVSVEHYNWPIISQQQDMVSCLTLQLWICFVVGPFKRQMKTSQLHICNCLTLKTFSYGAQIQYGAGFFAPQVLMQCSMAAASGCSRSSNKTHHV